MGPVPWEAMKCCHGSLMGINDVFRPQDTLCEVRAEIGSLSQNNSPPYQCLGPRPAPGRPVRL